MGGGPRIIAIDWSGARVGARRKIWLAEARAGRLLQLWNGLDREQVAAHLIEQARLDGDLAVGLDFAFSLPWAFLRKLDVEGAPRLWSHVESSGERWLADCQPPFWGRPGRRRPRSEDDGLRLTERDVRRDCGVRPKSTFQVGGAGAVGTGSLRGMPILKRLRAAGFFIWPFDEARMPLVVEIYPRLLTGPVRKSSPVARALAFEALGVAASRQARDCIRESEDAFDAAVSALRMAEHAADLRTLAPIRDPRRRAEGMIWRPAGHRVRHRRGAKRPVVAT